MKELFKCKVCNYVYNSELGDPISGVEKGTLFNDLPLDWICPVCSARTEEFEQVED